MKNLRNFALAAFALLGFVACQQEEFAPEIKNPTHSVTFVAGAPETKTTVDISDEKTAKFAWTAEDVDRFTVYEDGVAASYVYAELGTDGKMSMMATFPGEVPASPKYQALYNSEVSATQSPDDSYAEVTDVMVSNVLDGTREDIFLFSFKREVAFAKMTLKGLTSGAYVSSVRIESDKPIAGQYDLETGTFINTSNVITLNVHNAVSGGNAEVWFTTIPVEEATFTITAKTVNNDETVAATYTKTFAKTITLTRGNVKGFGVAMTELVDPHKNDNGWFLVKDARFLAAGDVIRIGCASAGKVAGALNEQILSSESATYKNEQMVGVSSAEDYTLGGTEGAWTLSSLTGKLGATAVKKLSISEDAQKYIGTWTITIDECAATIAPNAEGYGRILCNNTPGTERFTTYAFTTSTTSSMLLPEIYKKYGTPVEAKVDQTISFSPTSCTATIGAVNTYPTLTAQSTGAKTWSSSNTDVATIDESIGEIVLVAAGTTTISVTVAGDDTYNEGTGSFVLTVEDAQVPEGEWVKTAISAISASDIVVIVGSKYGIRNDEGTSSSPDVVSVTITNDKITSVVPDNIKWNISGNSTDGYVFYPNGDTSKWLYCNTIASSSSNNNIRVGTGDRKQWKPDANGYFVNTIGGSETYVDRVLSINGTSDWRSYINTDNNPQKLEFYVLKSSGSSEGGSTGGGSEPVQLATPSVSCTAQTENSLTFSWEAVANASGYQVSVDGGSTYGDTQTTTSYTWTGLTVSTTKTLYVKAIGDNSNYSDSEAASAKGATFGSYSIVFKTATSDGSTEILKTTESSTVVSDGIDYIASFTSNCSKAYYEGVNGVKLGSSKYAGTLEFNLADVVKNNVVSIKVETAKYGSDTGTITMYNGSTVLKSGINPANGYTHNFASPTTVESLKFVTSSKRAYISKITITIGK